jgi:hypothetical protein
VTTYDYKSAAVALGVSEAWLRDRTPSSLPHLKFGGRGGRVVFTDEHLAEIRAMFTVRPAGAPVTRADMKPASRRKS